MPMVSMSILGSGKLCVRCVNPAFACKLGQVNRKAITMTSSCHRRSKAARMGVSLVVGIMNVLAFNSLPSAFSEALHKHQGEILFEKACIGCHYQGGNVIQPGASLTLEDLDRNKVASDDDLFKIIYFGKARMPGFGEKCTPKGQCTFGPRLSDEDIQLLSEYVKAQANKGWK